MISTNIDIIYVIYLSKDMFEHVLESSRRDDSYKCSNLGLDEGIGILEIKYALAG